MCFADTVKEKRALDAGASTGGFTDVLLRRGAAEVVAVDVGYGQLAWELRQDSRVKILDRTNIRHLTGEQVGEPVDLIVADLSFISLTLVLPALAAVSKPEADYLLMVKPQFEVGREHLGAGGVVRDPALRKAAVLEVAMSAFDVGLGTLGVVASSLPGPAGNVEYFLWLRRGAGEINELILALSNDVEGEATCHYLTEMVASGKSAVKISRIGFGLPSGGGVLYADSVTLKSALDGRRAYS